MNNSNHYEKQDPKLEEYFSVLEIPVTSDWNEIRTAYLALAKRWHPDHNQFENEFAADRIRQLNRAYTQLKAIHKKQTKPNPSQSQPGSTTNSTNVNTQEKAGPEHDFVVPRTREGVRVHPKVNYNTQEQSKLKQRFNLEPVINFVRQRKSAFYLGTAAAISLPIAITLGSLFAPKMSEQLGAMTTELTMNESASSELTQQEPKSTLLIDSLVDPLSHYSKEELKLFENPDEDASTFGPGDSAAKVLNVQGPPNSTTATIWYYGDSAVVFEDGKVISWTNSDSHPLLISTSR